MVFKSDKQRKAVMAKMKSGTRSDVVPRFFIASGVRKGKKVKVVLETTASIKTLKRKSGVPILKLKRVSKGKARKLISLGRKRGFEPSKTLRIGRGRVKAIALTREK